MATIYTATEQELDLAVGWHGGQASMLYAVASTGGLSQGTSAPRWWDGEPMTSGEWDSYLVDSLRSELDDVTPDEDTERAVRDSWKLKLAALAATLED